MSRIRPSGIVACERLSRPWIRKTRMLVITNWSRLRSSARPTPHRISPAPTSSGAQPRLTWMKGTATQQSSPTSTISAGMM